jgi:hypothetical protein
MVDLLIRKRLTTEAQSSDAAKTSHARQSFAESSTFPPKTETSRRIAAFLLHNVINRHPMVKGPVAILPAHKHIEALVLIAQRFNFYAVREAKFHFRPPFPWWFHPISMPEGIILFSLFL